MGELKLTKEFIQKAHDLISEGHYAIVVCASLGIDESTYYKWLKKAEADIEANKNSIYVQLFQSIQEADAKAEIKDLEIISNAAKNGSWQASAWKLERKHKKRWSAKQEVQLSGDEEKPIRVKLKWD